jgi:hypothetical protein
MPNHIELTPQTAPRTAQELVKFTPIELRLLTDNHLAALRTDKEKMAWFELKTQDAKANYILALLKRWDEQNPGMHTNGATSIAGSNAPVIARAPVTAPDAPAPDAESLRKWGTMGPPPAQNGASGPAVVSPAALAAAVAATADKPGKRQPKTTAAEPPADLSANVIDLLNRILNGQDTTRVSTEKLHAQILSTLEDAASSKGSRVTALESKYEELARQIEAISDMANSIMKTQMWALMALLNAQSEITETSVVDILRCAIRDSDNLQAMVKVVMSSGKA